MFRPCLVLLAKLHCSSCILCCFFFNHFFLSNHTLAKITKLLYFQKLKALLREAILLAPCLAILLWHKLHWKFPEHPLKLNMSRNVFVAVSFEEISIKFHFSHYMLRCSSKDRPSHRPSSIQPGKNAIKSPSLNGICWKLTKILLSWKVALFYRCLYGGGGVRAPHHIKFCDLVVQYVWHPLGVSPLNLVSNLMVTPSFQQHWWICTDCPITKIKKPTEGSSIYIEWISRKFEWGVKILNYVLDKLSHETSWKEYFKAKEFNKLLFT